MEILGIGPSELLFIVVIALIVLGPRDMQKAGRSIGKWMRKVVTSDGWRLFQQTSREIQTLPNRLMREAALDELKELQNDLRQPLEPNRQPIGTAGNAPQQAGPPTEPKPTDVSTPDNRILPPTAQPNNPPTPPADDEDKHA